MAVTSTEQLITLDDWNVVSVNSHDAWVCNNRPLIVAEYKHVIACHWFSVKPLLYHHGG